jgi:DNA-binding Lrp family transcriptional regulator
MILEKNDVAALRLAEARGWFPTDGEMAAVGLKPAEYAERLRRLCSLGVIRGFKTTLVVPPLLGGDWVWAAVLASAKRDLGLANALAAKLPFVSEIVLNTSLPEKVGPNLAVLFYSRDFEKEAEFIRNAPGIEYHEVYRIADYSFPVALPLSKDEKALVRHLVQHPEFGITEVGSEMGRDPIWVRAKLDRLLWSETNRTGVLRVLPEVNWAPVENFGHFHFLIETGHRPDQLGRLVSEGGFSLVFGGKTYQNRYVQVEADVWGIGKLLDTVTYLDQIAGVRVAAVLWNREVVINAKWVPGLV